MEEKKNVDQDLGYNDTFYQNFIAH